MKRCLDLLCCCTRKSDDAETSVGRVMSELPVWTEVPKDDLDQAQKIWDYLLMKHEIEKSDLILVLGNHDIRTAEYACRLWQQGYAPRIMFSGDRGSLTRDRWDNPEAEVFMEIALTMGVTPEAIVLETKASNTGENILFSHDILETLGLLPKSIILIQMPYMERRTYATFLRQWSSYDSSMRVHVTSPQIPMTEYPNDQVGTMSQQISRMLGCVQRIERYPMLGFQIIQEIPPDVMDAYHSLIKYI